MSLANDLENLEQLRNRGALSETEYSQAKARLLQQPETPRPNASSSGLDTWLWRLLFVLMVVLGGTGLLLYVLMWILVPLEPEVPGLPLSSNH